MNLQFKHLGGVEQTIKDAEEYREAKELLKALSKQLPTPTRLNQWLAIDKEMVEKPVEDLPAIFQRVTRQDFSWGLGLVPNPILKANQVLSDKIRNTKLWKEFGRLLMNPENSGKVVVLFKLNRLGVWVMHNTGVPTQGTYICIPAQQSGKNNITIEPLSQWAERKIDG